MPKPTSDRDREIQLEIAQLKERMFTVLAHWTVLENHLSMLLQYVLLPDVNQKLNPKQYGYVAYFATDSAFTRFQLVDAIITAFFDREPHEEEALEAWRELFSLLNKSKNDRNKIAHGTVGVETIYSKSYVRVTGPLFQIRRHKGGGPVQPHGMSLNDVDNANRKCLRCSTGVAAMIKIVMSTRIRNHDAPTLQRICRELAEHLRSGSDLPFAPTPPILPDPP